ncbi:MAG: amidohydrolase [Bacillota bacterium]
MKHPLVLYNGSIITMDPECPKAEAVAIKGGHFALVGSTSQAKEAFPEAAYIDLEGKTALPGFVDSHCHFTWTGHHLVRPSVEHCSSVKECLEALSCERECLDTGEPLVTWGIDEIRLREGRLPTLEELDRAVPCTPLFCIYSTGHGTLVNSLGLGRVVSEASSRGVSLFAQDLKTGFIRGEANDVAQDLASRLLTPQQRERAIQEVTRKCVMNGVTTVHALEGRRQPWDPEVTSLLEMKEHLPLDIVVYYQTTSVKAVTDLGLPRIGGCVFVDGDFTPHTAALREPYADDPSTHGVLYFRQEELDAFVAEAHRADLQVALHCVGDAAIEQALSSYETALRDTPGHDRRHRIEHFEIPDHALAQKACDLGVVLAMQPAFDHFWDYKAYERQLGQERALRKNPFRRLLDQGLIIGAGSDSFVTPIDPLLGIHSCLNHSVRESRIGLHEAIAIYTIGSAYIGFEESVKGSIRQGKQADVAILSQDIHKADPARIKDIKVAATIRRGDFVWQSPGFPGKR